MTAPVLGAGDEGLDRAAALLLQGEVVAFPTDTVYGLAALAGDRQAEQRIYEIKRRPPEMPLITMAAELGAMAPLVQVSAAARSLAKRWWPGPLTLVLPVRGEAGTLGVRVPDHPTALALLRRVGRPLATTSANLSGQPAALSAGAAAELRGVAAVVDGGHSPGGRASTVLTLATADPEVLREGPVPRADLLLPLLADRFRTFAAAEAVPESPLYAAIAAGVAERPDVLRLLLDAQPGQRRPNLLLAAVHLLLAGTEDPLRSWYPDLGGREPAGGAAADAFAGFALRHDGSIREIVRTHRTQTNEVLRSAALVLALARVPGPVALIDAGCSAGLNLGLDRYRFDYGIGTLGPVDAPLTLRTSLRGEGASVPASLPQVVWRAGLDMAPLDPADAATGRWLEALVWPEQAERRADLTGALRVARAHPLTLIAGDLFRDLPALAAQAPAGSTLVVQHSAVASYLAPDERGRLGEVCRSLGAYEIALEWSAGPAWSTNGLSLDGRPLAECSGHGDWIEWVAG